MTDDVLEGEVAGPAAPPTNRMAVAVLSLVGLMVSLYLLTHSLGLVPQLACGVGDCGAVQASPYVWVGPIPVSGIGAVGYVILPVVALMGLQPPYADSTRVPLLLLGGTALGVAFSAYLTYLEAAVIHAWCQWCVISAILITLCFLAALPELKRLGGRP